MNKRKVLKNIISSLLCQGTALIYGFIIPALIIQTFGSKTNGLVSSITQFLSYIVLLEAGIGPVIKNALFKPIVEKKISSIENVIGTTNKFFKRISIVFIGYIFFLCCFYPLTVNHSFSVLFTISLILIISISLFFEYFMGMTYKLFLQADQKNYVIDYINMITYIISLMVMVLLMHFDFSIHVIKIAGSLLYVFRPLCLKFYFDHNYGYKINKKSNYQLEKKWDGLAHHVASVIQGNTDVVILTLFGDLISVSIYSIYSLVVRGIESVIVALTNGIDSFFGKMMVDDKQTYINSKFNMYSFVYYTLVTILLGCCLLLIIPFIKIYTSNITDANYVQPLFGYLLVFASFFFVIRYPFSSIVYAKGHFKETSKFSIVEPIVNILVSVVLIYKFGLIGVAIGTLVSMPIRSFGFCFYAVRKILHTKSYFYLKIIFVSLVELLFCLTLNLMIGPIAANDYLEWIFLAILVFIVLSIVIVFNNYWIFRKDLNLSFQKFKKGILKRE